MSVLREEEAIAGSGSDEIGAIRARVTLIEPGVALIRQVPEPTPSTVDTMFARLRELTRELPRFHAIVDLTVTKPPGAEVRAHLKNAIASVPGLASVACFTGRNFLLNVSVRFVVGRLLGALTIHRTFEEALEAVRRAQTR